jgi:hypothetical protein
MLPLASEESKLVKMEDVHRLAGQGGHRTGRVGAEHRRGDRGGGQEEVCHSHKACDTDTVKKGHAMKCPRANCDYDTAKQARTQQQSTASRVQTAGYSQQGTASRVQPAGYSQQGTASRVQPPEYSQHGHVQQQVQQVQQQVQKQDVPQQLSWQRFKRKPQKDRKLSAGVRQELVEQEVTEKNTMGKLPPDLPIQQTVSKSLTGSGTV